MAPFKTATTLPAVITSISHINPDSRLFFCCFGSSFFIFPPYTDQLRDSQQVSQGIGSVPELMLLPVASGHRQKEEFLTGQRPPANSIDAAPHRGDRLFHLTSALTIFLPLADVRASPSRPKSQFLRNAHQLLLTLPTCLPSYSLAAYIQATRAKKLDRNKK